MKLNDWHEREMKRNPAYAEAVADLQAMHGAAYEARGWRLRFAWWLGARLPFKRLPRWANNRLANFMWATPGFDYDPIEHRT